MKVNELLLRPHEAIQAIPDHHLDHHHCGIYGDYGAEYNPQSEWKVYKVGLMQDQLTCGAV
jgi:hypothetical protein